MGWTAPPARRPSAGRCRAGETVAWQLVLTGPGVGVCFLLGGARPAPLRATAGRHVRAVLPSELHANRLGITVVRCADVLAACFPCSPWGAGVRSPGGGVIRVPRGRSGRASGGELRIEPGTPGHGSVTDWWWGWCPVGIALAVFIHPAENCS